MHQARSPAAPAIIQGDTIVSYADLAAAAHLSVVDYLGDVPWNEDAGASFARLKERVATFFKRLSETERR